MPLNPCVTSPLCIYIYPHITVGAACFPAVSRGYEASRVEAEHDQDSNKKC